jgi:hypothetical protein
MFWSSAHCSQRNALIDRIASVPPGLSFEVSIAQGEAHSVEASVRGEQQASNYRACCAARLAGTGWWEGCLELTSLKAARQPYTDLASDFKEALRRKYA